MPKGIWIIRFAVFVLSLLIPIKLFNIFFIENDGFGWAIPAFAITCAIFSFEAWMSLRGRKTIWQYFNTKDKATYFVAMTVFLSLLTLPEKLHLPNSIGLLLGFAGLILAWLIIRGFGSPNMRKAIFDLTASREADPRVERRL